MSAPPPYGQDTGYGVPPPAKFEPLPYPGGAYQPQQQPPPPTAYGVAPTAYGVVPPPPPTVNVSNITVGMPGPTVVVAGGSAGGCPQCHGRRFSTHFGCCAIFLAIIFFPIGILCCLCMKGKKCADCGMVLS